MKKKFKILIKSVIVLTAVIACFLVWMYLPFQPERVPARYKNNWDKNSKFNLDMCANICIEKKSQNFATYGHPL